MKTITSTTPDAITYEFSIDDCFKTVVYHLPKPTQSEDGEEPKEIQFDHEAKAESDYQKWLVWLGKD
jgi:hypothetical protein